MKPSLYERLALDRESAHRAVLAAERREWELAHLRYEFAGLKLDLAALKLWRALDRHYRQDQPRVPAGNGRESGRWADGDGGRLLGPRFASRRPMRGSGATLRVAGHDYPATPSQAVRWSIADAQANANMREVRRHDPSWRPEPSLSSDDAEGWIRVRETQRDDAAARLRELGVEPPAAVPQEQALRPGGRLIGWREGRASEMTTRTCTPENFRGLLEDVSPGARQVAPSPPDYEGLWYRQPNGSTFGLRWSDRYRLTYDVISSDDRVIRPGFKVHQK